MKLDSLAAFFEVSVTSKDAVMGVETTMSPWGIAVGVASFTRGALAIAWLTGTVRPKHTVLTPIASKTKRGTRTCISPDYEIQILVIHVERTFAPTVKKFLFDRVAGCGVASR